MKIINRILLFIKHKGLSMRAFDLSIGASNGYTSKQSKTNASVGSNVLEKIIDVYPDLNPLWLITGKGNMIIDGTAEPNANYGNSIDALLEEKIKRIVKEQLKDVSEKLDKNPSLKEIENLIKTTRFIK